MKSYNINGVKTYTIASNQQSAASWLTPKKQRALRKDKNYTERLELIQDLRFETATSKIKITPDGEFLIVSGIYPPQVKVYELREFAMKFERHLDSEIVDFEILDDDYSKLAFLCADRSVYLHAKYGKHYSLRIPRMGRDMTYDCWSCDLLCAASSPDLYRINLEQGRFLSSLSTKSPALNVVRRSKVHGLVACGGEDGAVECFDTRTRSSVGRIIADEEVTAIEFDSNGGFLMGVGSSTGQVLIYDLRSSHPIQTVKHKYESPILDIKWHNTPNFERPKLITTDNRIVKIWDPETGDGMTSIEPTAGTINDICVFNDSGLMMLALDCSQIPSYFIPALGPVPKWCSTLESLTEELEEGGETNIYDNFKFLLKDDLEKLNLTHLIGTNLLRAYMHGFFVDYRLYKKAKALANPFEYEEYLEQRKKEKMEDKFASRITLPRKLPKINKHLAATIMENEEVENEAKDNADANETKKTSKKKKTALSSEVFKDERFAAMFENKDFEIDEQSYEYLALHPMAAQQKQPSSLLKEHFEPVEDEDDSDVSAASSEDEAGPNKKMKKSQGPRMYVVKDERHAEAFGKRVSLAKEDSLPLGERVKALQRYNQPSGLPSNVKVGPGGSREISFVSRSSAKYKEDNEDREKPQFGKKRGIQSLGLKPDRSGFGGRGGGRGRGRGGGRGRGRGRGGSRGRGGRF